MIPNKKIDIVESLIDTHRFEKALTLLDELALEYADNSEVYALRGFVFVQIGESDKALQDLLQAIKLDSGNHIAFWHLSQLFLIKEDYLEAEKHIKVAYEFEPENIYYISDYALIEERLKNYEMGIDLCTELLKDYPADAYALNIRGYCYLNLNKLNKAIKDLARALEEEPNNIHTLNNLGFALTKQERYANAKKYFLKAIAIEPNFAFPYDNLGFVLYKEGNNVDALKYIDQAIDIDKANSWAYKNRALVYISNNKIERALKDLHTAKDLGYSKDYDEEVDKLILQLTTKND